MDVLCELCDLAYVRTEPSHQDLSATEESIRKIQHELNFQLPEDFVLFSQRCGTYTNWFPCIGEDYKRNHHILEENRMWRSNEWVNEQEIVPQHLIVLFDWCDCNLRCWDTRILSADGQHPIVSYCADSPQSGAPQQTFSSFHAYLEWRARDHFPVRLPGVVSWSSGSWSEEREKGR